MPQPLAQKERGSSARTWDLSLWQFLSFLCEESTRTTPSLGWRRHHWQVVLVVAVYSIKFCCHYFVLLTTIIWAIVSGWLIAGCCGKGNIWLNITVRCVAVVADSTGKLSAGTVGASVPSQMNRNRDL